MKELFYESVRGYHMKHEKLIIYIMMLGTFGVLSTEMGVVGILPQIAQYFNVDITQAGLFVSLFCTDNCNLRDIHASCIFKV